MGERKKGEGRGREEEGKTGRGKVSWSKEEFTHTQLIRLKLAKGSSEGK